MFDLCCLDYLIASQLNKKQKYTQQLYLPIDFAQQIFDLELILEDESINIESVRKLLDLYRVVIMEQYRWPVNIMDNLIKNIINSNDGISIETYFLTTPGQSKTDAKNFKAEHVDLIFIKDIRFDSAGGRHTTKTHAKKTRKRKFLNKLYKKNYLFFKNKGMNQTKVKHPDSEQVEAPLVKRVKSSNEPLKKTILPIDKHEEDIIQKVSQNLVTILTGGTGCGKSTQVPKMLLKYYESYGRSDVRIICTQPRRIAAKSLARRVAKEIGCQVGSIVGFQVGLEAEASRDTKILFVTTGVFLQKLINDREKLLNAYSIIIMDEVHERDIDIDFSLIILKNYLTLFPRSKLILMSATICAEKFSNYFSKNSILKVNDERYIQATNTLYVNRTEQYKPSIQNKLEEDDDDQYKFVWTVREQVELPPELQQKIYEDNCKRERGEQFLVEDEQGQPDIPAPIIKIDNSAKYPIEEYYIDNINEFFNEHDRLYKQYEKLTYQPSEFIGFAPKILESQYRAVTDILKYLEQPKIKNEFKQLHPNQQGTMLIFLPGYQEIVDLRDYLVNEFNDAFEIIALHSSISQQKDLELKPEQKRRLIISTNIAESSITVPDCIFVIDFCMCKEILYNSKTLSEKLSLCYCSKASANQRKGRTGRVGPGYCFRLVPKEFYEKNFIEYSVCEMMRSPLERLILKLSKIHSIEVESQVKNEKQEEQLLNKIKDLFRNVGQVLQTALDPPQIFAIQQATKNLLLLGALNQEDNQITISQLGLIMCDLPIDLHLTKLIIYGMILGTGISIVNLACILSQKKPFFIHQFQRNNKQFLHTLYLYDGGQDDDIIIYLKIYQEWENAFFQMDSNLKQGIKYFDRKQTTLKEKLFCMVKSIDPKHMREILMLKIEIFQRINKFNLSFKQQLTQDLIERIKTVFAGSFMSRTIEIKKEDNINVTRKQNLISHYDERRIILLENESFNIGTHPKNTQESFLRKIEVLMEAYCEFNCLDSCKPRLQFQLQDIDHYCRNNQHSTRYFNLRTEKQKYIDIVNKALVAKRWIRCVSAKPGYISIEFYDDITYYKLEFVLKKFMHECEIQNRKMYKRNQNNKQIINPETFIKNVEKNYDYDIIKFTEDMQCSVFYGPKAQGFQAKNKSGVNFDQDSINFIQFHPGDITICNKMVVAYEIQDTDENKKVQARHTTCIMNNQQTKHKMWMQIIAMIFGVRVKIYQNPARTYFIKTLVDKLSFEFDHFLLEQDAIKINQIRSELRFNLLEPKQQQHELWEQFLVLRTDRHRIKVYDQEPWFQFFMIEQKESITLLQSQFILIKNSRRIMSYEKEIQANDFEKSETQRTLDEFNVTQFMAPIQLYIIEDYQNVPSQFDAAGIQLFNQINETYFLYKKQILAEINKQDLYRRFDKTTILICDQCSDYLGFHLNYQVDVIETDECVRQYFTQTPDIEYLRSLIFSLRFYQYGDQYNICTDKNMIKEFLKQMSILQSINKFNLPNIDRDFIYITCPSNSHILGFYPKIFRQQTDGDRLEKCFIFDSLLRMVHPTGREQLLTMRRMSNLQIHEVQAQESQARTLIRNKQFRCKACLDLTQSHNQYFQGNIHDFAKHVKDIKHKKCVEDLQRSMKQQ